MPDETPKKTKRKLKPIVPIKSTQKVLSDFFFDRMIQRLLNLANLEDLKNGDDESKKV